MEFQLWEPQFEAKISQAQSTYDPAHDFLHLRRVVRMAKKICVSEGGELSIVLPAAWFHDVVNVPKNSPLRAKASNLSASRAIEILKSINYPTQYYSGIEHAIESHSFSAGIEPRTLEAKIVQDADRLDGLGAIGIARCFATAGLMGRAFYSNYDPFCEIRAPDDQSFTVDHFFQKLFRCAEALQTESGKREGEIRVQKMKNYLIELSQEIDVTKIQWNETSALF